MIPSQIARNIAMLQLDQASNAASVRDDLRFQRSQATDASLAGINQRNSASGLRSEAANFRAGFNTAASVVGAVGTACAAIPYVGPIIAALCAAVAAALTAIGQALAQGKEDQAAAIEREAGVHDIQANKIEDRIDDLRDDLSARESYVDKMRDKIEDAFQQSAQAQRW